MSAAVTLFTEARDFLLAAAGLVASVTVVVAGSRAWFVNPLLKGIDLRAEKRINLALAPLEAKLDDLSVDILDIRHEVNTNRGKSLKDTVMSTREEVRVLSAQFHEYKDGRDVRDGRV
jgi:hypothetical protein